MKKKSAKSKPRTVRPTAAPRGVVVHRFFRRRIYEVQDSIEMGGQWVTHHSCASLREAKMTLKRFREYNDAKFNTRWMRIVQFVGRVHGPVFASKAANVAGQATTAKKPQDSKS